MGGKCQRAAEMRIIGVEGRRFKGGRTGERRRPLLKRQVPICYN